MKNPINADVWGRSKSVLAMAAGVAGHEFKHQVRTRLSSSADKLGRSEVGTRIEQAKVIADSLSRLKGAVMKAGQLLSIDASDILPPEASDILARLQGKAEPVDIAIIRGVLEHELGHEGLARLEALDPTPAASASIGQVHRAFVEGSAVAVKVQYPGIAESIDSDLAILAKVASSWMTLARRSIDLEELFDELGSVLHLEADYARERIFMDRFRNVLASDERFNVPRSHPTLSTKRVLTMSWEDGMALGDWIRSGPSKREACDFGRAVLDLYCAEFFVWKMVQTDPNFGNFLVHPASQRITLLDFGATLEYTDEFRERYIALLRTVGTGHRGRIIESGVDFGLIYSRESQEARDLFADMLLSSVEPFKANLQPFVFRDADYAARSRDVATRFTRSLQFSPPPRKLIFLHRKLGGLFQLLKRLDVELDLAPYWEQMIATPPPSAA